MGIDDLLAQLYNEPDIEKRRYIPDKLAKLGNWKSTQPLGKLIIDSKQPLILRNEAVESLGKQGDPKAIFYLKQVLEDPDQDIRRTAVWSLGQIGTPETLDPVFSKIDDPWIETRRWVAKAAGRIRSPRVIVMLFDYFTKIDHHSEQRVLADIIRGLASQFKLIPEPLLLQIVNKFHSLLSEDFERVVKQALMLFLLKAYRTGVAPEVSILKDLINKLKSNDPLVRPHIIMALGFARELEFLAVLRDPIALTALGPAEEYSKLDALMSQQSEDTNLLAILDGLFYSDTIPDLSQLYKHSNLSVVSKALQLHAKQGGDIKLITAMYEKGRLTYTMLDCLKHYGNLALPIYEQSALDNDKVTRQTTVQGLVSPQMQSQSIILKDIAAILQKVAKRDTIWHIRRDARIGLEQMGYKFE